MKNIKNFVHLFSFLIIASPVFVFAQNAKKVCNTSIASIGDVLCKAGSILEFIIPFMISLGVLYFIWGIVTFVISNDEEAKTRGRDRIIYGIIGFVVIFSMWGLVNIVIKTFGVDQQGINLTSKFVEENSSMIAKGLQSCTLSASPKLGDLINYAVCLINGSIIPLIFSLAVVMFIWGVVQYVINTEEEAQREKGKQFMIWGIIALTIMIGVWGFVRIVGDTFGIKYVIPQLQSK